MTFSTITAGLIIAVISASLEILKRNYDKEREEFENS